MSCAVEARGGKIIISDQLNNRVIVIKKQTLQQQYGTLNTIGYGTTSASQGTYAPYDAKVIEDYTGLTPPF